jgi:hypothetical protein
LSRQIVYFVRLYLLDDPDQIGGVGHVTIVQHETRIVFVRILIEAIDAAGIEGGGTAFDAVHFVVLGEQQFGQVGAILARDAGNQRNFSPFSHALNPISVRPTLKFGTKEPVRSNIRIVQLTATMLTACSVKLAAIGRRRTVKWPSLSLTPVGGPGAGLAVDI